MKRRLFKLALFLFLLGSYLFIGLIINVAVALICAVWSVEGELSPISFPYALPQPRLSSDDEDWMRSKGWNSLPNESLTFHGQKYAFGFSYVEYHSIPAEALTLQHPNMTFTYWHRPIVERTDSGWPFYSLGSEAWITTELLEKISANELFYRKASRKIVGGIEIYVVGDYPPDGDVALPRALPLRPIWTGFAINTIFYAAILWSLTLGPFTVRRMIRRKRGLCIKCGYDLRGHSGGGGCPECGWGRESSDEPGI